jgi:hypothetical protein
MNDEIAGIIEGAIPRLREGLGDTLRELVRIPALREAKEWLKNSGTANMRP